MVEAGRNPIPAPFTFPPVVGCSPQRPDSLWPETLRWIRVCEELRMAKTGCVRDKRRAISRWMREGFRVPERLVPKISACYGMFSGARCLYIGKTVNLRARMASHQIHIGRINGVSVPSIQEPIITIAIPMEAGLLDFYERLSIARLRPEMNVQLNKGTP